MSRARTPSTNKISRRGSAPAPESRVVDSNDEHRALFAHDIRRGLDALDTTTVHVAEPPSSGLACQLLQFVTTRGHFRGSTQPSPSLSDGRAERASEEAVRAGRRPSEDASFYPAVPRRTMSSEHPSSPARSAMMMGNTITPTSLGSRPPLRSTHLAMRLAPSRLPRRRRLVKRPSAFPHRPSGPAAP